MSEERKIDERLKVTSVGNSWIVLKSKSHPGRVYYFNSLTGEAAWNLSDAEIEKAKKRTRRLERVPGAEPTKCPEPKDNPPSIPLSNTQPAQSVPSEQFLMNRISEQQSSVVTYSNIANNNATFCTPFNQISGVMQGNQINNSSSIDHVCNLNPFNNSLSTYNLNTTPILYNPKIWAVPQTQQVFIAPANPIVNHSQGPLNIAYNPLRQTVPQPTTGLVFNNFDNASQSEIITRGLPTFYQRDFSYDQSMNRSNKNVGFTNKKDLREKLLFKKRCNNISSIPRGSAVLKANPRKTDIAAHVASKDEENHSNDLNTGMESRSVDTQLHETPSKIDMGPLKSLSPSDSNSDAWFIVVDLEVLLHEFKFLTTLTDSDEKCHLMVPKRVMEQLKTYITCTEDIQAKRILRFLSQQIEIGHAFMADEPPNVESDSMAEVIHKTCTELLDTNYHVILLTNDDELLTKISTGINMFSIDEIKNLLMVNPNKQQVSSTPKKPFLSNEIITKIKIVVPNNTSQNTGTTCSVKDIQRDDHIDNIPIKPSKENNTPNKIEEVVLKHTVDAGIQTDLEDINASISMTNVVGTQSLDVVSNSLSQKAKEAISKSSVSSISNIPDKRREIKLKRSTSYQPPVNSVESEKKQFKWRRKRNTSLHVDEQIPPHYDQHMNTTIVESQQTNTLNNEISKLPDIILKYNPTFGHIENEISGDSIENRESGIYADPNNSTTKENVTVEETSSSGIISNTESSVDANSTHSNSPSSIKQQLVCTEQSTKPMYEVDSIAMEQYLETKFDEWISRFIQIMEEALTQVLQQDPSFTHTAMPPPWTLHEAAQCIAIKFCGHKNIIAATDKLSLILMQVSDPRGKITMNMTPPQYMQMYSYGVHLLSAVMEVTTNCEDIKIAMESLNKLLHDIRNPNMESSTNDCFNDNKDDNISNNDVSVYSDVQDNSDDSSLHEQEMLPVCNHMEETHKDKSKKRKSSEELEKPVKFIRNIDVPFSSLISMSIQKNNTLNKVKLPVQSQEQNRTRPQTAEGNNSQNANAITEKETDNDVPTNRPSIIRHFYKCPELEKKLKANYNLKVYEDHDDVLDYDESYDVHSTEDYYSEEDENYNDQHRFSNDNQTDKGEDTNVKNVKDVSILSDENSKKFKYMMCMLLREVRYALGQVRILCDRCYKELKNPKQSTELQCRLRKMAERAHLHTIRLCRSLESMLDHETNNPSQSISDLLKQADINIHHVDAGLLLEYRITVAKCKKHADEFRSSIQNIIINF